MFFVFDGMDGAGKTTQLELLAGHLRSSGHEVVICKDPGTTELGCQLRELLLVDRGIPIDFRSELLLFVAARAQLTEEVIRPAIATGKIVLCDRYVFSTVVYQGYGGNIPVDEVWRLNEFATSGLVADLTFIFEIQPELAQQRLGPKRDRMESRGMDYFRKLREGFLTEVRKTRHPVVLINANDTIDNIQDQIRASVIEKLDDRNY